jgi:prevent-host-death family protein
MPVTEFKAHALRVISDVADTRQAVVVTKRGRPLVEVISFRTPGRKAVAGKLAHTLISAGDIVSPLGAALWDAAR